MDVFDSVACLAIALADVLIDAGAEPLCPAFA
jgi:hypothetical protein